MKKNALLVLTVAVLLTPSFAFSADEATVQATTVTETTTTTTEAGPAVEAVPAPAAAPVAPAEEAVEATVNENLEFVSGEVSAIDAAAKSVTVKLYGETDETTTDQLLTVTVDESTDITDGEKDRELASLAAGTEVDVEYDPATKKATYIFVY